MNLATSAAGPSAGADMYFRAIERSFEESLEGQSQVWWLRRVVSSLNIGPLFVVTSFGLPFLVSRLAVKIFGNPPIAIHFRSSTLTLATQLQDFAYWIFFVCWLGFQASVILFDDKQSKKRQANFLNARQMRFAYCYAAASELRSYQNDGLPKHLLQAVYIWRLLLRSLRSLVTSGVYKGKVPSREQILKSRSLTPSQLIPDSVQVLQQSFSWFVIHEDTKTVLKGFELLPSKLSSRLEGGRDAAACVEILTLLGEYFYSNIPGVTKDVEGESQLKDWGDSRLLVFAQKVLALPDYTVQSAADSERPFFLKRISSRIASIAQVFAHENILVCFVSWLSLCTILVCVPVWLFVRFKGTQLDSTLIALVIGTPLLTSATLVALSRKRNNNEDKQPK